MFLDFKLNFQEHFENMLNKANKAIKLLRKLQNTLFRPSFKANLGHVLDHYVKLIIKKWRRISITLKFRVKCILVLLRKFVLLCCKLYHWNLLNALVMKIYLFMTIGITFCEIWQNLFKVGLARSRKFFPN